MRESPRPQTDARWTADGRGHKVILIEGAALFQMFRGQGHIRQRIQLEVLVICQDEHNVRTFLG